MKKALALVLALVMCMSVGMMAFAAATDDANGDGYYDQDDAAVSVTATDLDEAGTADTNVDILVNTKNISCTVPLDVTIVALVGGGNCYVPSDYKIENTCLIDIEVVSATVSDKADDWNLIETKHTASGVDSTAAGKNEVYMDITNGTTPLNLFLGTQNAVDLGWTVPASSPLALTINATSSILNTTQAVDDAFTVTYTIAAA